jgi:hypothetical protein
MKLFDFINSDSTRNDQLSERFHQIVVGRVESVRPWEIGAGVSDGNLLKDARICAKIERHASESKANHQTTRVHPPGAQSQKSTPRKPIFRMG